ncbi:MAG TPA: ATP-binding cassette domain-containing protein [Devosia sp.]|nr:ATP-binding cassette domain-containing protein [Devosia sp.]
MTHQAPVEPIIQATNLRRTFVSGQALLGKRKTVAALDDVSFEVLPGTTFGIVGESGSGKSTTARVLCGLESIDSGSIAVDGQNVTSIRSRADILRFRRTMQMVFQDPYASLDPNWRVGNLIAEGMRVHNLCSASERNSKVAELLQQCGMPPEAATRFPHEFSGGQRQRISIARALAVEPKILVLDEPVSALDVSIQAQILILLQSLQKERNLTYVLISHNLAVVEQMSQQIAVMKSGKIVEVGDAESVIHNPSHEYTRELIRSTPTID